MGLDNGISAQSLVTDVTTGAAGWAAGTVRGLVPSTGFKVIDDLAPLKQARAAAEKAKEEAQRIAAEQTARLQQTPDGTRLLSQGDGWINSMIDGFRDFILGSFFKDDLAARTTMYARIGLDAKGNTSGPNPFASVDEQLGIKVASSLQTVYGKSIRDDMVGYGLANWLSGLFGSASDRAKARASDANEHALKAHHESAEVIYKALVAKHGQAADVGDRLKTIAHQAASTYSGISPQIAALETKEALAELAKSLPQSGVALMYAQANSAGRNIAALAFSPPGLQQAIAGLKVSPAVAIAAEAEQRASAADAEAQKLREAAAAAKKAAGETGAAMVASILPAVTPPGTARPPKSSVLR